MKTNDISGNKEIIISFLIFRKVIGWLGIILPVVLLVGNYGIDQLDILNNSFLINTNCSDPYIQDGFFKSSISFYYYSTVSVLFTGTLITVAFFMLCYKGHKKREGEKGLSDNALTNLAGISVLGVVLFPTGSNECIKDNIHTFLTTINTGYIHYTMAAIFFISLALISMVNFRRTGDRVSFGKKRYHNLYLLCGISILVSIVLIFIYGKWIEDSYKWLDNLHPVFCLEAIALIFFGISWLTKGRVDFYYIPKKLKIIR